VDSVSAELLKGAAADAGQDGEQSYRAFRNSTMKAVSALDWNLMRRRTRASAGLESAFLDQRTAVGV
jgi:hypothetical protein